MEFLFKVTPDFLCFQLHNPGIEQIRLFRKTKLLLPLIIIEQNNLLQQLLNFQNLRILDTNTPAENPIPTLQFPDLFLHLEHHIPSGDFTGLSNRGNNLLSPQIPIQHPEHLQPSINFLNDTVNFLHPTKLLTYFNFTGHILPILVL